MTIHQKDLRAFVATFHRNGIMGESFYLCTFDMRHGREWYNMRAAVFDTPGHVAVISESCLERWRGDEFEPALREAIALQNTNQPDRCHDRAERAALQSDLVALARKDRT